MAVHRPRVQISPSFLSFNLNSCNEHFHIIINLLNLTDTHPPLGDTRVHLADSAKPVGARNPSPLHLRPETLGAAIHLHQPEVLKRIRILIKKN